MALVLSDEGFGGEILWGPIMASLMDGLAAKSKKALEEHIWACWVSRE